MTAYLPYFIGNLRSLLSYRVAALAGFVTQAFWGLLRISIFSAFYSSLARTEQPPMALSEMVAYVWIGQGLFVLLPLRPDPEALELVREGGLAYELTRPVDLYAFWLSRSVALRLAPAVLRLPLVLAFAFALPIRIWSLSLPPSLLAFACFIAALAVSLSLAAALTALMSVLCLWIQGGNGLAQLLGIFAWVTSGLVLPLPMFPPAIRHVLEWLPFAGIMDTPLRLYSGHLLPSAAAPSLLRSLIWVMLLVVVGRAVLRSSLRRVEVQGG